MDVQKITRWVKWAGVIKKGGQGEHAEVIHRMPKPVGG